MSKEDHKIEKDKKLTWKQVFTKKGWKEHGARWTFGIIITFLIGLVFGAVLAVGIFLIIARSQIDLVVSDNPAIDVNSGVGYIDLINRHGTPDVAAQVLKDFYTTTIVDDFFYAALAAVFLFGCFTTLVYLYFVLRHFHIEKHDDSNKNDRDKVWIKKSARLRETGDHNLIENPGDTNFSWEHKDDIQSGLIIGSIFLNQKQYDKINKEQAVTEDIMEEIRESKKTMNWKNLPKIDEWNRVETEIFENIKTEIDKDEEEIKEDKHKLKVLKHIVYDHQIKTTETKESKLSLLRKLEILKNYKEKDIRKLKRRLKNDKS